ncbi:heterotetrameric sarcosine oxidase gamma subunit [Roseibium hamelinense]|uniref:Heterotetrameric sarcosine oxidase gamma subunit n=1 Tax=Roseibium hamelinense TaxID=150831 RepID=A0A562STY0_9HYPH|nr:sarcosine oxidase subunit gamma [Roseibium hamelinense]MTI43218.1 sarcosine oxidase subunit gamma [Roseibium hamelinense]TWI84731.1 heterotetrameric sarcosine oxidase gamma subunit [Roseibium hamelinense]
MAEWTSALESHLSLGRFGTSGVIGVTLSEVGGFSLTQISAWPEQLEAAGQYAARLGNCETFPGPGQCVEGAGGTLMRVEPLKWWLIAPTMPAEQAGLPNELGAELDLSSSRTWIRVSGPDAEGLLNRFLPLNLSGKTFPTGSVASSAIHHIGITLWRSQEGFNLLLPRSFAASIWELLTESATQFGAEVVRSGEPRAR